MGLRSAIAIFTTNKTRIRFVSDFTITDQQVAENTRRLTFDYSPESPGQILGQDVSFLAQIETLAVNYSDIFRQEKFLTNGEAARMTMALTVNGIELFSASIEPKPDALAQQQVNLSVAQLFKTACEIYDARVSHVKTQR